MVYTHLILRYGELFLKGKNRPYFERQLLHNIKTLTGIDAWRIQGRLIAPFTASHAALQSVFGLTSYSLAKLVGKEMASIQDAAAEILQECGGTFKVQASRSDKSYSLTSPEINRAVGEYVEKNTSLKADLVAPQHLLGIEIHAAGAFLFAESIACCGGLPSGVGGKVALLVEDDASILAGILMLKRGCEVVPVSVTGPKDLFLLHQFSVQKSNLIIFQGGPELITYINQHHLVLVSGENFEQRKNKSVMTLRPLIAFSKDQIKEGLNKYNGLECQK